jgi:PIN domain nuclease of toxin-antitoxin system
VAEHYVFDAYAVLAWLGDETGAERVEHLLTTAARDECRLSISTVNLGEVMYTIERRFGTERAAETLALLDQLPVEQVAVDRELALRAARVKAATRMGYADCFAVALAVAAGAAVVTGDPDFEAVADMVTVEWLKAGA